MDWLEILRRIEKRGALEKMRKVRQRCNEVYRYAIVTGRAEYNPVADLSTALAGYTDQNRHTDHYVDLGTHARAAFRTLGGYRF